MMEAIPIIRSRAEGILAQKELQETLGADQQQTKRKSCREGLFSIHATARLSR